MNSSDTNDSATPDPTASNDAGPRVKPPGYGTGNLNGILVVDKPLGWSSMHVIRRVRRAANMKKVGHAGTLDPLATGVVVVCLGKATRLVEKVMGQTKVYLAQIDLSGFTATDDREAPVEPVTIGSTPTQEQVVAVLSGFKGIVMQTPPAFSAIHVQGQRAYDLARKGREVKLAARPVRIDEVRLVKYDFPFLDIEVTCGKGTYIRSLARDIGVALGTGGHLSMLRRTRVGPFDLARAVTEEKLAQGLTQSDVIELGSESLKPLIEPGSAE